MIQSKGIGIVGAFIIGLDGDTPDSIDALINFIVDNNVFVPQVTILTPLPGTRLYDRFKTEDRLLYKPWSDHTFLEVNFRPKACLVFEIK